MKYIPLAILSFILSVGVSLSFADPSIPVTQFTPEALVADLWRITDVNYKDRASLAALLSGK